MRNPIRRSRKIGQTQGGRVKGGKAREKFSRIFSENIWFELSEEGGKWKVVRENPSSDFFHPCKAADYLGVLECRSATRLLESRRGSAIAAS